MTKPTPSTLDKAVAHLARQGADRYFFDRLNSPEWVEPLYDRGFFQRPPDAIRNLEEGTIAFPDWPELRYLLRMAPRCPETAGNIVADMPQTDNVSVHELLVQIGLSIPRAATAKLADAAFEWLDNPFVRLRPGEHFAKFVAHLADQGELKHSKRLATRLLGSKVGGKSLRSATDAWHLERNLAVCLPSLQRSMGVTCLALLCKLLREAMDPEERSAVEDYSYIWRANLEAANHSVKEMKDILIDAIRDSAVQLAQDPTVGFSAVREILLHGNRPVFRRLSMYVATRVADSSEPYVSQVLFDPLAADRMTYRAEYAELLEKFYPRLTQSVQQALLTFLTTDYLRSIPEERRNALNEERTKSLSKTVERNRLVAFGSSIPAELTARRDALVAELGSPREAIATTVWLGPRSPLTDDQLEKMSLKQIVDFGRAWEPEEAFDAPRPEGLGRALQAQVKLRLTEFADGAPLFAGLPPTYVRGVISGFSDAVTANQAFDWTGVLALVSWVSEQPPDERPVGREFPEDVDPGWSWTRQTIARLVERGLTHDASGLRLEHRPLVWSVIKRLLQDSDPTADSDSASGDTDALTRSINSVRGLALHAVLRYQWWVHEALKSADDSKDAPVLELYPEVVEALERSLEDPAAAVRCALGEYFPTLFHFNAEWAASHVDAIFPDSNESIRYWVATWATFVEYAQPYDAAFEALRSKYDLALDRLRTADTVLRKKMGERGLGQHLGSYFWRSVDGERSLERLLNYFEVCSPDSAGQTMWFLARGLAELQSIPESTLASLKSLWTQLSVRAVHWSDQKRRELHRHFGTWFASPHLDGVWALGALKESLASGAGLIDVQEVLGRLDSLARDHPLEVSACLAKLIRGEHELLRPLLWEAELGAVLKKLLNSDRQEVKQGAGKLVDLLVEKGALFARDLVTHSQQKAL